MKYRKLNKPITNTNNKPYCKRIVLNKTNVDYSDLENKQTQKKEIHSFIPPVHKNKYIYPNNVPSKECKEEETDTNTSANESAFQNDFTPKKETVIIQTHRRDNFHKSETNSRNNQNGNVIKVQRMNNDDNKNQIHNFKELNSSTSTLRDLIKTHKKANSTLFIKDIDCRKAILNRTSRKEKDNSSCINSIDNSTKNEGEDKYINTDRNTINFTTMANSARQRFQNSKNFSSLMRDKTVNHLLNNSLIQNSHTNSKFQSKNTSANSSIIVDSNSYSQSIPLTSRQTTKHTLSTSMPCSFIKNHNTKSVSSLITSPTINFQEVLEMQIKLNHILLKINNKSSPHLELFSWWNYFYKSNFLTSYQYYFENNNNKKLIDSSFKLEALTSILCLEISKINTKCKKALDLFKSIFSLTHFNFLIFIKFLLVKSHPSNIFADKLNNIIKNELSDNIYNRDMTESFISELIKHNTKNIAQYYKELIQRFYIDNKKSKSNVINYNLNSSRYSPRNKINATRNIRLNKQEDDDHDNEHVYYSFFTNAFSNLNAYTYDDYNDFILEYINDESFDYDLDSENCFSRTARNDNGKTLDNSLFSECNINNDFDSNSFDIAIPDNISTISEIPSPKENISSIKPQHKKTNSCSTISLSISSFPFPELLNQLITNNKQKLTNINQTELQINTENNNNYNITHPTRSRSPNILRQSPLLNSMYFLPPISKQHEYTLILDLDETLVHVIIDNKPNSNKAKLIYRPYLFEFLSRMKRIYEIVIFTVSTEEYADKVCDCIERKEKFFDYKLYRQHVTYIGREYYKDLSKLGRDLKKVVIVDNMPQNFELQKENGIAIKPFYGDCSMDKNLLYELGSILERIRFDSYEDVRKSILKYREVIKNKIS